MKHLQLMLLIYSLAFSGFAQSAENDETVYTVVEEMPRFPGCEDIAGSEREKKQCAEKKMLEFIYANVEYPSMDEYISDFESLTLISFIVEKDGCLNDMKVIKGHPQIGKALVKIFSEKSVWIPGKQNGQAVAVRYQIPFRIHLQE